MNWWLWKYSTLLRLIIYPKVTSSIKIVRLLLSIIKYNTKNKILLEIIYFNLKFIFFFIYYFTYNLVWYIIDISEYCLYSKLIFG